RAVSTRYRSTWNRFTSWPRYSWIKVNVGLVTSSCEAAWRPSATPFTSVVLPAPKSPRRTTMRALFSVGASLRPSAIVSSAERVMYSCEVIGTTANSSWSQSDDTEKIGSSRALILHTAPVTAFHLLGVHRSHLTRRQSSASFSLALLPMAPARGLAPHRR